MRFYIAYYRLVKNTLNGVFTYMPLRAILLAEIYPSFGLSL
jgi:hypothetical protein